MNAKEKYKWKNISTDFGWYWAIITILLCSATAFWVGIVPTGNTLDFPISVISAERILSGERPYVDFSALYGPLGHYIKAMGMAPFRIIFPPAQALQYFTSLVAIGYTVFVVILARRRLSNCPYMFRFLMLYLIIAMPTIATKGSYSLLEMLLVVFACFAAQKAFREPNTYVSAFFLALITVVLLFSRLNFGIYLVCALCVTLGVQIAARAPHAWSSTRKVLLFLILSVTVITGILFALGIMHNYFSETITYLSRFNARQLPLALLARNTSSFWWPFVAAVGFVVIMLAVIVVSLKRNMQGALYISLLGPSFLHYALVRFDAEHLYPLVILLPVFTVIIAEESAALSPKNQSALFGGGYRFRRVFTDPENLLKAGTVAVMVLFALSFNPTPLAIVKNTYSYHRKNQVTFLQNSVPIKPIEYMLLKSLWERDGGIGAVFFGNLPGACESTVHVCTNVSLYLAKGQLPKTYFWYFDTPSTPYDDTQRNIIADIDRKKIKWIVLQGLIRNNHYLPGNPKESRIFFDYVVAKYSPENRFIVPESNATYQIFRRREIQ